MPGMVHSLLVSRDAEALSVLQGVMSELQMRAEVCDDVERAAERLIRERLDAVVVDYDEIEHAAELLRLLRLSAGKNSIALAIVNGVTSMQAALETGANFVLVKPVSPEAAGRSLRAVKGLLNRIARRSARLMVHTLAFVTMDGMRDRGFILDISQGGMAIQALDAVEASRAIQLDFELPGSPLRIVASGEIAWADVSGRAGVRFVSISEPAQQQLKDWLLNYAMSALAAPPAPKLQAFPGGPHQAALACISLEPNSGENGTVLKPPVAAEPTVHRVLSALVDGGLVLLGNLLFCLVVFLFSSTFPGSSLALLIGLLVPCLFWAVYHYIFLAHPQGTPGMQVARLGSEAMTDDDDYDVALFGRERTLASASSRMLAWLEAHAGRNREAAAAHFGGGRFTQITIDPRTPAQSAGSSAPS
ncbi:MAG TPA: PilZ domain-containing protein [Terriglobales bacterium]|nr:PilZ domain-containing protein [Terriglobales bacterium]